MADLKTKSLAELRKLLANAKGVAKMEIKLEIANKQLIEERKKERRKAAAEKKAEEERAMRVASEALDVLTTLVVKHFGGADKMPKLIAGKWKTALVTDIALAKMENTAKLVLLEKLSLPASFVNASAVKQAIEANPTIKKD